MVLCDRSGTRMPAVRENMQKKIGEVYKGLDLTIDCFPADDVADDPEAFVTVRPRTGGRVIQGRMPPSLFSVLLRGGGPDPCPLPPAAAGT